eukprot:gene8170-32323_t
MSAVTDGVSTPGGASHAPSSDAIRKAINEIQANMSQMESRLALREYHGPSWKFPCACGTDMDIEPLLARYEFVGPDPRHALVAKAALLELLVDRMMIMSGVTLARCSNSSSAHSTDSVVRNGKQAINQFVTLCEQAVHLKDAVDTVITELDPDAAKENGAPIADADAGGAALDDSPALWFPLFEKIEQAARATRTKNVLATTALPFGKPAAATANATATASSTTAAAAATSFSSSSSSSPCSCACSAMEGVVGDIAGADQPYCVYPRTICGDCSAMRAALAAVEHTTVELGLVDTSSIGEPGQSPLECNKLCFEYLESHDERLRQLVLNRDVWALAKATAEAERDDALEEAALLKMQLAAANATLAEERKERAAELQQLHADYAAADQEIEAAHLEHVAGLEAQAAAALASATEMNARSTAVLEERLESKDEHAAELSEQLDAKACEVEAAAAAAAELEARLEARQLELGQVLTRAKQDGADAESAAVSATQQLGAAAESQLAAESFAASLQQQLSAAETQLAASHGQVESLQAGAKTSAAAAVVQDAKVAAVGKELAGVKSTNEELVAKQKAAAAELQDLQKRLTESEKWLDRAGDERSRLMATIASLGAGAGAGAGGGGGSRTPSPVHVQQQQHPQHSQHYPQQHQQQHKQNDQDDDQSRQRAWESGNAALASVAAVPNQRLVSSVAAAPVRPLAAKVPRPPAAAPPDAASSPRPRRRAALAHAASSFSSAASTSSLSALSTLPTANANANANVQAFKDDAAARKAAIRAYLKARDASKGSADAL